MARSDEPIEPESEQGQREGISPRLVAGVLVAVALLVFITQNTDSTEVTYLAWEIEAPLFAVLLVTALATLVITELVGGARRRRKRKRG